MPSLKNNPIDELCEACLEGDLPKAERIFSHNEIHLWVRQRIFDRVVERGHLNILQWIHSLGGIDIHRFDDIAFRESCNRGYLEVSIWLYSLGGIDSHQWYDGVFESSCKGGHLDVAQWLYSLGGVDIHRWGDHYFRMACLEGKLEVAKWLYSLGGVNIRVYNDCTFRDCCIRGLEDVVKWLCTLCLGYFYRVVDGRIEYNILDDIEITDRLIDYLINYLEFYDVTELYDVTEYNVIANASENASGNDSPMVLDPFKKEIRKEINNLDVIWDKFPMKTGVFPTDKTECQICYDNPNDHLLWILTKCNHLFCLKCGIQLNNSCPYCRSTDFDLKSSTLVRNNK